MNPCFLNQIHTEVQSFEQLGANSHATGSHTLSSVSLEANITAATRISHDLKRMLADMHTVIYRKEKETFIRRYRVTRLASDLTDEATFIPVSCSLVRHTFFPLYHEPVSMASVNEISCTDSGRRLFDTHTCREQDKQMIDASQRSTSGIDHLDN